ncbi:tRNA (guanosine(37)-N1)-methyltransferase TrmD [Candidatus Falkowbacteria bacterium CG10_big_fil_rev_8_21_14_0_10_43_11]|uniref:tRNA (guanine-N(1)-)-methyltransferase n=1 Tax=Candidatus Falkowbacteria bacterium CG10_big_fil_rev_8_21_14_0_10_43_11 TaxID=1974568 RepID=A0A2M6WN26_9BACT|nr:MAG: tRNA (guanosine(37)-N1)-methyltransferase TrmD [Candidatus Falkowbacteria bacterium CG10_big_fil_rev_8_21_14_0_10_43_11]
MTFHIITIFPHIFDSYFSESIIKRAQNKKIIKIKTYDLRTWAAGRHKQVDDRPFGGGAGMVLMAEPIIKALRAFKFQMTIPSTLDKFQKNSKIKNLKSKIILLSAKGKKFSQTMAERYAKLDDIILICGRYEGVDERVKKFADEEISIGDYVLTGGEIPAMAIVDSITRLLPGALGNAESIKFESHSQTGILEHPHYTRPEELKIGDKIYKVPKILLSGDHKKIEGWRKLKSKKV